jgi:hypothetical protein
MYTSPATYPFRSGVLSYFLYLHQLLKHDDVFLFAYSTRLIPILLRLLGSHPMTPSWTRSTGLGGLNLPFFFT